MAELMTGKRGLVMGVANDRSIAWGIAKALHAEGAKLAFSYQGEAFGKRVEPLAASVGSDLLVDVDVTNDASMDACFATLKDRWGTLDFVVHAIAYSDKNELTGRFINTSRENFRNSLTISCYSFIERDQKTPPSCARGRQPPSTLTYQGSNRASLLLQTSMGVPGRRSEPLVALPRKRPRPQKIRATRSRRSDEDAAGARPSAARSRTFKTHETRRAPARENATLERWAARPVYSCVRLRRPAPPGESFIVDGAFHGADMPQPENLMTRGRGAGPRAMQVTCR